MAINVTVPTVASLAAYPSTAYNTYVAGLLNGIQASWDATYTPALTSSGTNPVLGTGNTASGTWIRFGHTILAQFDIVAGSTFTAGTGTYEVSLPAAAVAGNVTLASAVGSGYNVDASPLNTVPFSCKLQSTTTVRLIYHGGTTGLSATTPTVPAASDSWHGILIYQAA